MGSLDNAEFTGVDWGFVRFFGDEEFDFINAWSDELPFEPVDSDSSLIADCSSTWCCDVLASSASWYIFLL